VIVLLNGAFGAGKTTTALRLPALIPGSRLFDPETVGYMLQPNLADHAVSDFQHWPPWRPLVASTAAELARYTGEHLIAPQTVLVPGYLEEIFTGLRAAGLAVFHVLLDADEDVLRRRILGSDEAQEWRLAHLTGYRAARPWLTEAADLVVDTGVLPPDEVANKVASAVPGLGSG
jgi:chloramphenicol 3-O-phosphotransferase